MLKDGVIFYYAGPISQSLMEEMGDLLKIKISERQAADNKTMIIFSIFVEQVQNIVNHSLSNKNLKEGIILVGKNGDKFFVIGGNIIDFKLKKNLIKRLEEVKRLDKESLKILYKEKFKKSVENEGIGAGLGIIDMARKCSEPLEYNVKDIDESSCFFALKTVV